MEAAVMPETALRGYADVVYDAMRILAEWGKFHNVADWKSRNGCRDMPVARIHAMVEIERDKCAQCVTGPDNRRQLWHVCAEHSHWDADDVLSASTSSMHLMQQPDDALTLGMLRPGGGTHARLCGLILADRTGRRT